MRLRYPPLFHGAAVLTCLLAVACDRKKPDKVIVSEKGDVVAVQEGTVNGERVVVVKDSALIWPSAEATIRSQTAAANSEDLDAYLSYVHPDNADFVRAREEAARVFAGNDLKITLETVEAESVTEGEVKARFTLRTEKLSGPEFRNNRMSGTYTLRKHGGVWKIFATRLDKVDYLDAES